jgi:DNA-binding CsgD family transcriptional regulator
MQPIDEADPRTANRRAIAPSDPGFFRAIGQAARAIGTETFHEKLLGLFGAVVSHDYACIVRYSRNAPPDIIYTKGLAKHLLDYYLEHAYYSTDPFFCDWRSNSRSGVIRLRDAMEATEDKEFYRAIFQHKARFSDEMAMFLPALGKSCIALFIEKKNGDFSDADETVAQTVFPAIEGLHRAHLAHLFSALRRGGTPESREVLKLPTLILDRAGACIHANAEWRSWERSDPRVKVALEKLDTSSVAHVALTETAVVRVERFDRAFQLAPGGKMFVIVERPAEGEAEAARSRARSDMERLSRRERQIVALLVLGVALPEIAQRLGIRKGTVKNYRLSLYRKLAISSERTLISRFWPLIEEFRSEALAAARTQAVPTH